MKENKAKSLIDIAFNELIESIEKGQSEVLKNYMKTMGRFHNYSFTNIMLISMQFPTATRVAGFHTWRKLDRYIMKGEKGIKIIAPIIRKKEEVQKEIVNSEHDICGFRIVTVFDISQTNGKELPAISTVEGDPKEYCSKLNELIFKQNIQLEYSDDIAAEGYSSGGKIVIKSGLSLAEDFSVRVHEFAHEFLHQNKNGKLSKKQKETEAEAVAFVVSSAIGLDANTAFSDYIQMYQGDKETLMNSIQRIKEVSSRILEGLGCSG
ncbi:MAG: DUF1738 domain-containing protein [candidate division Zixibacteria bacterium]|nr:DUF1738 domain-containing protein [candidate division Zixibacteria bacterium]